VRGGPGEVGCIGIVRVNQGDRLIVNGKRHRDGTAGAAAEWKRRLDIGPGGREMRFELARGEGPGEQGIGAERDGGGRHIAAEASLLDAV
jgi:hypothetical protein